MTPHIVVLGAGVIGLTSAVSLLEAGFRVTVRAERFAPDITSSVAAGLWYPYAAAGSNVPALAVTTLRRFRDLASVPASGVKWLPCKSYEAGDRLRPFWSTEDVGFRPFEGGFESVLPRADSAVFLTWLANRVGGLGGNVERLTHPVERFDELDADLVINCTGLGARQLCGDGRMIPIKGTVVVVENPGIDYCLTDDLDETRPTYFIPTDAGLVLGGSAEHGNSTTHTDPELVTDIIRRCAAHEPRLNERRIHTRIRMVKSGLRPGRDEVRIEAEETESGTMLVHNYGHGGSGYTLCWGCAAEVVRMVSANV